MRKAVKLATVAAVSLVVSVGFILLFAGKTPAQGADLHMLVSDGVKPAVQELVPQIEHSIGRKLVITFGSSKGLIAKIQSGEPFDVAIFASDSLDELIKQGKVAADTRVEIARAGMGVGVRAGAAKPDISTPEALKQTLLKARSITFNPSGASSGPLNALVTRLGIADAVKAKYMLDAEPGRPQMNVADGKAELVITLIPEIKFFPGVELVGPLPGDLQSYITFAAGVATNSHDGDADKTLIKFLKGPVAAAALKSKALEPR